MPSRNKNQITSSSSHKSSFTPKPSNCVQEFLNVASNRMSLRELPHINASLRKRAQNAIRNVEQNNDLLEFIGDRAVNLVMAIMVEEVKISYAHHKVCDNAPLAYVPLPRRAATHICSGARLCGGSFVIMIPLDDSRFICICTIKQRLIRKTNSLSNSGCRSRQTTLQRF